MSSRVVNVPQQRGFDSPEEEMVTVVGNCQRADRRHLIDGKAAENFVHVQYLLRDGFGVTDQQSASGSAESIKLCARSRGPSAFFTDLSIVNVWHILDRNRLRPPLSYFPESRSREGRR